MTHLTRRERHFLNLINPTGTIGVGTSVGHELYRRGLVLIAKWGRYGITPSGVAALAQAEEVENEEI